MALPVAYSEVLLLFQGVDERDQEVLVVEKSGEQSDSLLNVGPCCVGGLKTRGWVKLLFICVTEVQCIPRTNPFCHLCVSSDLSIEHLIFPSTAFDSAGTFLLHPLYIYIYISLSIPPDSV